MFIEKKSLKKIFIVNDLVLFIILIYHNIITIYNRFPFWYALFLEQSQSLGLNFVGGKKKKWLEGKTLLKVVSRFH